MSEITNINKHQKALIIYIVVNLLNTNYENGN
jgi:hypothetical protein